MRSRFASVFALLALVPLFAAERLAAQGFVFTKIADSSTAVPEGTGTFGGATAFRGAVVDGGQVAFIGSDASGSEGVYRWSGGRLERIADSSFAFPGSTETFSAFVDLDLDGDTVAFSVVSNLPDGREAVFRDRGEGLEVVADTNTLRPGAGGTFRYFGSIALAGDDLLLAGGVDRFFLALRQNALYRFADGELQILADESTEIPQGSGTFPSYGLADLSPDGWTVSLPRPDSTVNDGIYRNVGIGGLRRIADSTTSVPEGTGDFDGFRGLDMDASQVAFVATGSGGQFGVYVDDGGLRRVADTSTRVPGLGVPFSSYSNGVALSGDEVAFSGPWAGGGFGLFLDAEGSLERILLRGQFLDGKTVDTALVETDGFSSGQMAVTVTFTDGSAGLYLVRRGSLGGCLPSATALCLAEGRFRVSAQWTRRNGETGAAFGNALSGDSGTFFFFRPENVEMLVKILNACQQANPRFWVFAAGLTNLDVTLTVEDTQTGAVRAYQNPQGAAFEPIQDTQAFETCP